MMYLTSAEAVSRPTTTCWPTVKPAVLAISICVAPTWVTAVDLVAVAAGSGADVGSHAAAACTGVPAGCAKRQGAWRTSSVSAPFVLTFFCITTHLTSALSVPGWITTRALGGTVKTSPATCKTKSPTAAAAVKSVWTGGGVGCFVYKCHAGVGATVAGGTGACGGPAGG